jgi:hypothetical protein
MLKFRLKTLSQEKALFESAFPDYCNEFTLEYVKRWKLNNFLKRKSIKKAQNEKCRTSYTLAQAIQLKYVFIFLQIRNKGEKVPDTLIRLNNMLGGQVVTSRYLKYLFLLDFFFRIPP